MSRKLDMNEWVDRIAMHGFIFLKCNSSHLSNKSKIEVACPEGHTWDTTFSQVCNKKSGCPYCAKKGKRTKAEREAQIRERGFEVINWVGEYRRASSEVVVRCPEGHVNTSTVNNIVNGGKGCYVCGRVKAATSKSTSAEGILAMLRSKGMAPVGPITKPGVGHKLTVKCDEVGHEYEATAQQIIRSTNGCKICAGFGTREATYREKQISDYGNTFIRWRDGAYKNASSVAVVACGNGHERHSTVDRLVNGKTKCPRCKVRGFDQTSQGVLYCLLSDDSSMAKIGVTNCLSRRILELRKETPFNFTKVATIHGLGRDIKLLEREALQRFTSAGLTGFNGATEWLVWSPGVHSWLLAHS